PLPEEVFHPHLALPRRRNFFRHAIAPVRSRFEQLCSSLLPPQISPFSFPIHEHRHPLFRDAPRARRFVSAFQLSPSHLGQSAAQRCLISCARTSQTCPVVASPPVWPTPELPRLRLLQYDAFPLRWLLLSRYETDRFRP